MLPLDHIETYPDSYAVTVKGHLLAWVMPNRVLDVLNSQKDFLSEYTREARGRVSNG